MQSPLVLLLSQVWQHRYNGNEDYKKKDPWALAPRALFLRRSNRAPSGSLGTRTRVGWARTRSLCQLVDDQFSLSKLDDIFRALLLEQMLKKCKIY
jgi:hypothetical protein